MCSEVVTASVDGGVLDSDFELEATWSRHSLCEYRTLHSKCVALNGRMLPGTSQLSPKRSCRLLLGAKKSFNFI